ncbi:hypothetical protein TWF102_009389 [Orbilia oligospora]|uniref:LysM domain-containing protein n=1 Tax=Orbilia oligospora TaxID=2813651 RepID=A0A7C8JP47_ORBOL|nr:hypothetical protein TWF102_009389 [Orbilia oligospora]KAF3094392.1 hypothetical protein TWF103_010586 [Orbilia oligospora]KAF3136708.1 hypothetical protein TWF703_005422 [Orbilia oligospora]
MYRRISQLACSLLFAILLLSQESKADFKIFQLGSALIPSAASSRCRVALTTNIVCDPLLQSMVTGMSMNLTTDRLDSICTAACGASIKSYATGVQTSCGSSLYVNSSTPLQIPVTDYGNENWWKYNVTCLKDSTGKYCQLDKKDCSTCNLQTVQMELNSPFGQPRLGSPDTFADLKKTCSVATSLYPLTYTASAAPTETPKTCSKSYTSKAGDTCVSIAKANSVSTGGLINLNSLDARCKYLVTGTTLCLPDTCALHVVKANETCLDIIRQHANTTGLFSQPQLLSWNFEIDPHCENIGELVGYGICVSPPGTTAPPDWQKDNEKTEVPKPSNGHPQSNKKCGAWHTIEINETCDNITFTYQTKQSDFVFLNPGVRSDCTNLQAGTAYCVKPVGSIRRYDDWKPVQFPSDILTATINPDQPPNNRSHTYLWPNSTVPVTITVTQLFPPAAETSRWATYTLCPDFAATNPDFEDGDVPWYALENEAWMSVYDEYCMIGGNRTIPTATPTWPKLDVPLTAVAPPGPTNSGAPKDCLKWVIVGPGMNTCPGIAAANNITVEDFKKMNPWIDADCRNLWAQNAYCVDTIARHEPPITQPPTTTTTSRTTTTTSRLTTTTTSTSSKPTSSTTQSGTPVATVAPPGPTESGTSSACTRWHVFATGETCTRMLVSENIKLPAFQALNLSVNSACNNLKVGTAYCVAGA